MGFGDFVVKQAVRLILNDIAKNGSNSKIAQALANAVPSLQNIPGLTPTQFQQNQMKHGNSVSDVLRGAQGWNNPDLQLGPSRGETIAYDIVAPLIGDAAKAIGEGYGAYNSLLGGALQAVAQNNGVTPHSVASGTSTLNNMLAMQGAGLQARGAVSSLIGDTLANRAYTFADTMKDENRLKREKAYNINEDSTSSYWANQRRNLNNRNGAAGRGQGQSQGQGGNP